MITPNVRAIAEKRGITTSYQLMKALESSPSVAAQLWSGNFTRLDLSNLNKLCRALKCKPNDLLVYEKD